MKEMILRWLFNTKQIDVEFIKIMKVFRFNPHYTAAHCATETGVDIAQVRTLRNRLERKGWLAGWADQNMGKQNSR